MKISKQERAYIYPALILRWRIEIFPNRKYYWDGDKVMPVKVGVLCKQLVDKGLLNWVKVREWEHISVTDKANMFLCKSNGCYNGKIYNDNDEEIEKCTNCEGTGIILEY